MFSNQLGGLESGTGIAMKEERVIADIFFPDWGGDLAWKSTWGSLIKLANCPEIWSSNRLRETATSTLEIIAQSELFKSFLLVKTVLE